MAYFMKTFFQWGEGGGGVNKQSLKTQKTNLYQFINVISKGPIQEKIYALGLLSTGTNIQTFKTSNIS
jgi:hypothetical protein